MNYTPGDIANGHAPDRDDQWNPLGPAPSTATIRPRTYWQRYRARWRKTFWACCGVALLGALGGHQQYGLLDIAITVPLLGAVLAAIFGLLVAYPISVSDYRSPAPLNDSLPPAQTEHGETRMPHDPGTPQPDTPPAVVQRGRRWTKKRTLALTGAGVVVLLIAADLWQANREMDSLVSAAQTSNTAIAAGDTNYVNLLRGLTADTTLSDLINKAESTCADSATAVENAQSVVEDVTLLPWHRTLTDAKAKYVQFSNLWLQRFRNCATAPVTWGNKAVSSEILADWQISRRAFHDAEPIGGDHSARIKAAFGS